jgi:hypothetical protein
MSTLTQTRTCDPATAVTRSLLGYGLLAGPFYVVVSLSQALSRDGFDLTRHSWSLLANGDLGWLQITNFILTGLMVITAAVGLGRSQRKTEARLIGTYGLSLIAAGLLRADPAFGFPLGTPAGPGPVSWHGVGHLVAGSIGFAALIAACFVAGRRYAKLGNRSMKTFSRITGVVFFAAFAGIATGGGSVVTTLGFVAAVVLAWSWLFTVCLDQYRTAIK